jgi:hypothetical protein
LGKVDFGRSGISGSFGFSLLTQKRVLGRPGGSIFDAKIRTESISRRFIPPRESGACSQLEGNPHDGGKREGELRAAESFSPSGFGD